VFGEMRIEEAVSPNVGVTELWITLIAFTLVYGLLMVADVWLLWKYGSAGTQPVQPTPQSVADGNLAVNY